MNGMSRRKDGNSTPIVLKIAAKAASTAFSTNVMTSPIMGMDLMASIIFLMILPTSMSPKSIVPKDTLGHGMQTQENAPPAL